MTDAPSTVKEQKVDELFDATATAIEDLKAALAKLRRAVTDDDGRAGWHGDAGA